MPEITQIAPTTYIQIMYWILGFLGGIMMLGLAAYFKRLVRVETRQDKIEVCLAGIREKVDANQRDMHKIDKKIDRIIDNMLDTRN